MSELAFKVKADYREAVAMNKELQSLRAQMLALDTSTEKGAQKMEVLSQRYSEVSSRLSDLVDKAASAAVEIGNGANDANHALSSLMTSMKHGEDAISGVIKQIREQGKATVQALEDSKNALKPIIDELESELKELRVKRNEAISSGDSDFGKSIQSQMDSIEKQIKGYRDLISAREKQQQSVVQEIDSIEESIKAYDKLAAQKLKAKELTEEAADSLNGALQDALDLVMGKTTSFQDVVQKSARMFKETQDAVQKYKEALEKSGKSVENLSGVQTILKMAQDKLHTASLNLGKALIRMGYSATEARVALQGLTVAIPVIGVALAAISVTLGILIGKYRKQKQEAEEAAAAQEEFFRKVGEGAAPTIKKFGELREQWTQLKSEMEQQEFLEKNAKALKKVGIEVNNVVEADDIFINKVEDYVRAQLRYAEADIYRAQAQEKIAKAAALQAKIDDEQVKKKIVGHEDTGKRDSRGYPILRAITLAEQIQKNELEPLIKEIEADQQRAVDAAAKGKSLLYQLLPDGPEKPSGKVYSEEVSKAVAEIKAARAELKRVETDSSSSVELVESRKERLRKAMQSYKDITGENYSDKASGTKRKTQEEKDAENQEKQIKSFGERVADAMKQMEDTIAKEHIAAIQNRTERTLAELDFQKKQLIDNAEKIGKTMSELFSGNVDLLHRNKIDTSKLNEKGWDAGEGYATLFSSQTGITDRKGKVHEILYTPILPDGSVLSPAEMEDYLHNVLEGADDFLKADDKHLVIAVDVDPDGKSGDKLHEMQELYYELLEQIELFTNKRRAAFYKKQDIEDAQNRLTSAQVNHDYNAESDALQKLYTAKIKQAEATNQMSEAERLRQEYTTKSLELEKKYGKGIALVFGDVSKYTKKQLAEAKAIGEAWLKANKNASVEDIKAVKESLNNIDDAEFNKQFETGNDNINALIKNTLYLVDIEKRLGEAKKKNDKDEEKRLTRIKEQTQESLKLDAKATGVNTFIKGLSTAASLMSNLAKATENVKLSLTADVVGGLANVLESAAAGYAASGSWIGAVVGGGISIVTQIANGLIEAAANAHALEMNLMYVDDTLRRIQVSNLLSGKDMVSVFGTDTTERIRQTGKAIREMKDALDDLNESAWDIQMKDVQGNFIGGKQAVRAIEKLGLNTDVFTFGDFRINTGTKKSPRAKDLKSLSDIAEEWGVSLYDSDGTYNIEFLQTIQKTYTHLTKDESDFIQKAIDDTKLYKDAVSELRGKLEGMFGNTASILADATIEGLSTGATLGGERLKYILGGVAKDLQKQMVESLYASYLNTYMDDFIAGLTGENGEQWTEEDMLNKYADMIDGLQGTIEMVTGNAEKFREIAESRGFNMDQYSNQSATRSSAQQITETTGSAIEGRVTSIQIAAMEQNEGIDSVNINLTQMAEEQRRQISIAEDIHTVIADSYLVLVSIRNNTEENKNSTASILEKVELIEKNTRNL